MSPYDVPAHAKARAFLCHLLELAGYIEQHPTQKGVILHDIFSTPWGDEVLSTFEALTGLMLVDVPDHNPLIAAPAWLVIYRAPDPTQEAPNENSSSQEPTTEHHHHSQSVDGLRPGVPGHRDNRPNRQRPSRTNRRGGQGGARAA